MLEGSWGRYWVRFSSAVVCALLYLVSLLCTCDPLTAVWRKPMQRLQRYSNSFWTMTHPRQRHGARQQRDAAAGTDGDVPHHPLMSDASAPLASASASEELAPLNDLNRPDLLATAANGGSGSGSAGAGAASAKQKQKQKGGKNKANGKQKQKQKQSTSTCSSGSGGAGAGAGAAAGASSDDRVQHAHPSIDKKTRKQFTRELNMRLSHQVDRISAPAPRPLSDQ